MALRSARQWRSAKRADKAVADLLQLERAYPGSIVNREHLRLDLVVCAHAVYDGMYVTNVPFSLVSAGVSLAALIGKGLQDFLVGSPPIIRYGIPIGIWTIAGVMFVVALGTFYANRSWVRASVRIGLLSKILREQGPKAAALAQLLTETQAGVPPPPRLR